MSYDELKNELESMVGDQTDHQTRVAAVGVQACFDSAKHSTVFDKGQYLITNNTLEVEFS